MSQAKITPISTPQKDTEKQHFAQELTATTQKDMGKVGLIIAILAVILASVLFFGLNQNLKGLTEKVTELSALNQDIQNLNAKVGTLESKIATLENLPQKTKNIIIANTLQDMAQKAKFLSSQVQTQEQATKLLQAQELLREVQVEVGSN